MPVDSYISTRCHVRLYSVIDLVRGALQLVSPLQGSLVSYSTFQMAWEVIEKQGDYELAYRWLHSKQKAENSCLGRIKP